MTGIAAVVSAGVRESLPVDPSGRKRVRGLLMRVDVPNAEGTLSALCSRDAGNQLVAASVDLIPASPAAQQ